eukprot:1157433-Pelagomonas_calceolata.AAC.10
MLLEYFGDSDTRQAALRGGTHGGQAATGVAAMRASCVRVAAMCSATGVSTPHSCACQAAKTLAARGPFATWAAKANAWT